uniref:Uncharacterized protein n=1 Tax=Rhizophora mucronata TaxID=61149 RepID=A0A2P2N1I7_RHIMU
MFTTFELRCILCDAAFLWMERRGKSLIGILLK